MKLKITCLLLGTALNLCAQKVVIENLHENRSFGETFFSNRCEIDLKVIGDEVRRYKFARIAELTKAEDDKGLDLKMEEKYWKYEPIDGTARVRLLIHNSSREAKLLKELSGSINLFSPSETNGGTLKITNYDQQTNKNLTPKVEDLKVIYFTKASRDKFLNEQKAKSKADLDKLSKDAKSLIDSLLEAFEGLGNMDSDPKMASFVFLGDTNKLIDLFFEDNAGKKIMNNGRMSSSNVYTYYFDQDLNPNWKLVLNIESQDAIKKVPFILSNIDLP
jgi:hypothetical protein